MRGTLLDDPVGALAVISEAFAMDAIDMEERRRLVRFILGLPQDEPKEPEQGEPPAE